MGATISFAAPDACAQKTINLIWRVHFPAHIRVGAVKAMLASRIAALAL
jgi:hypothetical protein